MQKKSTISQKKIKTTKNGDFSTKNVVDEYSRLESTNIVVKLLKVLYSKILQIHCINKSSELKINDKKLRNKKENAILR